LIRLILKEIGILEKGHLVKVTRSDLIGAYPEQTISQTESILKDSFGGALLIDNAQALIQDNNENGILVLDTICRFIDNYRHKHVILLECSEIGYKNLIKSNAILKEKFPHRFEFDNYSPRQLLTIAAEISDNLGYILDEGALQVLLEIFSELFEKGEITSLNSKAAKSILYKAITNQEQRILGILNPSDIDLKTITLEDVQLVNY